MSINPAGLAYAHGDLSPYNVLVHDDGGGPELYAGGGFDGTYYSEKGNEDIISAGGNGSPPPPGIIFTNGTDVAKMIQSSGKLTADHALAITARTSGNAIIEEAILTTRRTPTRLSGVAGALAELERC